MGAREAVDGGGENKTVQLIGFWDYNGGILKRDGGWKHILVHGLMNGKDIIG